MLDFLRLVIHALAAPLRTQAQLEAEIALLRHQLKVLRRRTPRLTAVDRLLFAWLCQLFPSLRSAITIVQPETVPRGHRPGFRLYWRWKSRSRGGRPRVPDRGAQPDPANEHGELAVGRAAYSWRAAEAWD